MSRRRPRGLTPLERELWRAVTQDVERSGPPPRGAKATSKPAAVRPDGLDGLSCSLNGSTAAHGKHGLEASGAASAAHGPGSKPASKRPRVLPPSYRPPQSGPPGGMARARRAPPQLLGDALEDRARRRLNRGQAEPDARIDLHGMRQADAFEALRSFVLAARARRHRLVLVVTGKGDPVGTPARLAANEGRGVIRRAVPRWLALPDLAPHVLGFETAGRRHGGEGALYVRLRR